MGSISDYLENELLDHVFNAAYTPAATVYLALHTADPTDDGSGAEANYTSYARAAITFGAASSRRVTQSGAVTFPKSTGGSNTITHWSVFDASSSGNMLAHGAFAASKSIVSGNTPSVASGEVYVEYSAGEISDYLSNKLLDLAFRNTAYSAPDTYLGLTTATISDSNTGSTVTEVSGGSYARVQVNPNGGSSPTWDAAASGVVDNTHDVSFPEATGSWGTVVALGIFDASTSGNLLFYDNDLTDQAVSSGDTVTFPAGDIDIQMT
jgi:hypothetical protein